MYPSNNDIFIISYLLWHWWIYPCKYFSFKALNQFFNRTKAIPFPHWSRGCKLSGKISNYFLTTKAKKYYFMYVSGDIKSIIVSYNQLSKAVCENWRHFLQQPGSMCANLSYTTIWHFVTDVSWNCDKANYF